jgi:hypothetical protein
VVQPGLEILWYRKFPEKKSRKPEVLMGPLHEADVLVVGNGILGYSIAFALLHENPSAKITLIGPSSKPSCASVAAGAMLNSFAELEEVPSRTKPAGPGLR